MTRICIAAFLAVVVSTHAHADNFLTRHLFGWPVAAPPQWSSTLAEPHSAVARIIVPEGNATSYGSGTLIDVRDEYGLVITNWHVVRDSTGVIEVVFPSGFRSHARALKVDQDWDLAALVIWRPPVEPVPLANRPPQPGDVLTIHGYGQGQYRIATGRCTQYYAPRNDFPAELVELNVEARQGDSGGPIFNSSGEMAGVLFGAGRGTTIGSFGGRVNNFLATLAPDIGRPDDAIKVADREPPAFHTASSETDCPGCCRNGTCPINRGGDSPALLAQLGLPSLPHKKANLGDGWTGAGETASATTQNAGLVGTPLDQSLLDQGTSLLAIVGGVALVLQFVRLAK